MESWTLGFDSQPKQKFQIYKQTMFVTTRNSAVLSIRSSGKFLNLIYLLQGSIVDAVAAEQHLRDALHPLVLLVPVPALELDHPLRRPDPKVPPLALTIAMASVLHLPACPGRYLRAHVKNHTWNATRSGLRVQRSKRKQALNESYTFWF